MISRVQLKKHLLLLVSMPELLFLCVDKQVPYHYRSWGETNKQVVGRKGDESREQLRFIYQFIADRSGRLQLLLLLLLFTKGNSQ